MLSLRTSLCVLLLAAAAASAAACGESTSMKGASGRASGGDATPSPSDPGESPVEPDPTLPDPPLAEGAPGRTLVTCNHQAGDSIATKYPANGRLTVEGLICLPEQRAAEVALIVDISGSMLDADPIKSGTCGREAAVNAILDQLQPTDKVTIVTFSRQASTAIERQETSTVDRTSLADLVCNAETDTNYKAAFDQANAALADAVRPFVYLVSDGLPQVIGDPRADSRGLDAADRLRKEHPDATIGAVYLGTGNLDSEAAKYLAKITGASDRVRLVADAEQLAEAILEIDRPGNLTKDSVKLALASGAGETLEVAMQELTATPTGEWHFVTEEFALPADKSAAVAATLELAGSASPLGSFVLTLSP